MTQKSPIRGAQSFLPALNPRAHNLSLWTPSFGWRRRRREAELARTERRGREPGVRPAAAGTLRPRDPGKGQGLSSCSKEREDSLQKENDAGREAGPSGAAVELGLSSLGAGAEDSGKTHGGSGRGWLGLRLEISASLLPGLPEWLRC